MIWRNKEGWRWCEQGLRRKQNTVLLYTRRLLRIGFIFKEKSFQRREVALRHTILVFIGGGIGSVCRYGISLASTRIWGASFPYGTLIVNLVGCFLIGVFFSLAENTKWFTPTARIFLMTGMMGGLTTFSSYGLESMNLALGGDRYLSVYNILATNLGGLVCVFAGLWAGKQL